jgi:Ca2+:H+ antiporter
VTASCMHRVLALLLPASFYAAISGSTSTPVSSNGDLPDLGVSTQTDFLSMSRGLAVLLLLM